MDEIVIAEATLEELFGTSAWDLCADDSEGCGDDCML